MNKNLFLIACKRWIEDAMGEDQMSIAGFTLFCGRNFFRAMLADPEVRSAWTVYGQQVLNRVDRNMPNVPYEAPGFTLADNIVIVDMGQARITTRDGNGAVTGTNGFIDDNSAYLVPRAPGLARRMFGPSTMTTA